PTFANLTSHGGFMPKGILAVLAGAGAGVFSVTGGGITTIPGAGAEGAFKGVSGVSASVWHPLLTLFGLFVLLVVCVIRVASVVVGESPFTRALETMNFSWASGAMSVIILTAVLSCLNSAFYVCSRVLFLLAEHNDAPQYLVQLNARRVPTRSVWMGSLAGVIGIMADKLAHAAG